MTIPADLAISSTASIIYNNGFTTAHSSTLNFLKGLMIAYFEQLSRRAKEIPEKDQVDCDPNIELAMDVIFEMGYNGVDGLKEYMHNVKSLTVKALPQIPVKKLNLGEEDTFYTTMNFQSQDDFPSYTGLAAIELGFHEIKSYRKRTATSSNMDISLDSLASPILALRLPDRKKNLDNIQENKNKEYCKGKFLKTKQKRDRTDNIPIQYRAVHSIQGIKLRIMDDIKNTPPGYYSTRSMKKIQQNQEGSSGEKF